MDFNELVRSTTEKVYSAEFQKETVTIHFGSSPVGKILEERRKQLMKFCNGRDLMRPGNNTEVEVKRHLLYDKKHKFVYCQVEKIGSTFWKGLFQMITGMVNVSDPFAVTNPHTNNYQTISNLPFDRLYAVLQESKKFVIARDPYDRLLSGYLNKMFEINPYYWAYGKNAIKMFRKSASVTSLRCGHDVTFPEFVKYFIYTEGQASKRDSHFVPVSDHCRPCQIKYDIIAKMETFKEDTLFVVNILKIAHLPHLQNKLAKIDVVNEKISLKWSSMSLMKDFGKISKCLNKSEAFRRAWRSNQFRGYIGKDIKYPLSKEEEETIDGEGLNQMFQTALEKSGKRETRLKNRQLFSEEAYSQVSVKDLNTLSEIFNNDCGAFGYNCKPDYIFDRTIKHADNFFNIWGA